MPKKYIRELRKQAKQRILDRDREAEEERARQEEIEKALALYRQTQRESSGDEHPVLENMDEHASSERLRLKTTQVVIQAGSSREFPLSVFPGCTVEWAFQTQGGDIAFGVMLDREDGTIETLIPKERVASDEETIHGKLKMEEGGTLWLQWDNTFSWFTNKQLVYSIHRNNDEDIANAAQGESGGENIPRVIFVLGGPGSGKGTQCARLTEEFGMVHLSAGDLLRAEKANPESKDGALIAAYIKEGKIVPIEITVKLLLRAMKSSGGSNFLIDGFPRNQDNLDGWERETRGLVDVVGVFSFECPEDVMINRLLKRGETSGRIDDNEDSIRKRLHTFARETIPIIRHYENLGKLWSVNTNRTIDQVYEHIRQVVLSQVFPDALKDQTVEQTGKGGNIASNLNGAVADPVEKAKQSSDLEEFQLARSQNTHMAVRIILGTMTFSHQVNATTSKKMLDAFLLAPCALRHMTGSKVEIDTARMYNSGKTEILLGDLIHRPVSGDSEPMINRIYVATKANPFKGFNENLRPENVVAQLEASLEAMKLESVDLLYLHAPDHGTSIEATLKGCQQLYEAGKFRELGLSNYTAWETVHIWHVCHRNGWVLPTVYQGMYNAITRQVEDELFPALRKLNMRFYAYNPLAGGMLTGKHQSIADKPKDGRFGDKGYAQKYGERYWKAEYFEALDLLRDACDEAEISMANASIRWLAHHSVLRGGHNDGIILGASSMKHLEANLAAANAGPLPQSIIDAFDKAWITSKPSCPSYHRGHSA